MLSMQTSILNRQDKAVFEIETESPFEWLRRLEPIHTVSQLHPSSESADFWVYIGKGLKTDNKYIQGYFFRSLGRHFDFRGRLML